MPTPVFLETSVVRAHAQKFGVAGIPPHPEWSQINNLVSKLGGAFRGITSRYVITEAINSFMYDLSHKYKEKVSIELRELILSQYRRNIADVEKRLEVNHLWQSSEASKRIKVGTLYREVNSWYNSLDQIDIAIFGSLLTRAGSRPPSRLEPSDRIILSESRYVREQLGLFLLLFATLDRGFIMLGTVIREKFGIDPRHPRHIRATESANPSM